jgi:hypothetical protein
MRAIGDQWFRTENLRHVIHLLTAGVHLKMAEKAHSRPGIGKPVAGRLRNCGGACLGLALGLTSDPKGNLAKSISVGVQLEEIRACRWNLKSQSEVD